MYTQCNPEFDIYLLIIIEYSADQPHHFAFKRIQREFSELDRGSGK